MSVNPKPCPCCGGTGTPYSECSGGNMYGDNVPAILPQ